MTHLGSSFNDFLEEEGLLEEAESVAVKRVLLEKELKIGSSLGGVGEKREHYSS